MKGRVRSDRPKWRLVRGGAIHAGDGRRTLCGISIPGQSPHVSEDGRWRPTVGLVSCGNCIRSMITRGDIPRPEWEEE